MPERLDSEFLKLYTDLGFISGDRQCRLLYKSCKFGDKCWAEAINRKPEDSIEQGRIYRPWVGSEYDNLKLLVIGINMNEYGEYDAMYKLAETAADQIRRGYRRLFRNKNYKGSTLWHRMGCYAAAIANEYRLFQFECMPDGYPAPDAIIASYKYIAFTNHIKCSPRDERSKPTDGMWQYCGGHVLLRELNILRPSIILILGISKNQWSSGIMLGQSQNIAWQIVGAGRSRISASNLLNDGIRIKILAVPHPSAIGQNVPQIIKNLKASFGE